MTAVPSPIKLLSKSGFVIAYGAVAMKISVNWLNDYVQTNLSAEQIAEILSDVGFPCEGIESPSDDVVIDLEITSNRGDCLGHIGIARELAAATGKKLKLPEIKLQESEKSVSDFTSVEISEPDLCWRYTARIIEGIKVGSSPDWMKKRIEAVGIRSVNNIVDATNYAMLETGQPPHAFDYDKLAEGKIVVRKALAGERIVSIDGSKCELETDMLIIADGQGPVAIAGVMGGLDSEVSQATKTILLEDAYFDPVSVRRTSRRLGLASEAAFRFERTVDVELIDWASKRTAQLITQVAGGKVAKGVADIYPKKQTQKQVTLRLGRLKKLLGIDIPSAEVMKILSALSFKPTHEDDSVTCSVPSWRSDIYREADLIEEVARVYGYDKIPTERKIQIEVVPVDPHQKLTSSVGTYLNSCGFYETVSVTFIDDSVSKLFGSENSKEPLAVKNESRKHANILRPTVVGSLLGILKTNLNAGNTPCRIFEIADTFIASGKGKLPIEKMKLALVCDGDFRDLRGVVEGLIKSIDSSADVVFEPADLVWAQAGAKILVDGAVFGTAGIVSSSVQEKFDFKNVAPVAAEIEFDLLAGLEKGPVKVKPIARFPAIERDLSIVVDDDIRWADVVASVSKKGCNELEEVKYVGIYRGKGVGAGKKSVTLSLLFRDEDGTLTHEAVDRLQSDIVAGLEKDVGAELRTV